MPKRAEKKTREKKSQKKNRAPKGGSSENATPFWSRGVQQRLRILRSKGLTPPSGGPGFASPCRGGGGGAVENKSRMKKKKGGGKQPVCGDMSISRAVSNVL